jgi:Tol biopolymer transport system component
MSSEVSRKPIIIFDTSGINNLADEKDFKALAAGLRTAYHTRLTGSNIEEIAATTKPEDRGSEEKGTRFVYRVKEDGSELQKVVRNDSGASLFSVSPDGKWVAIPGSTDEMAWPAMVYPVGGGSPTLLCVP